MKHLFLSLMLINVLSDAFTQVKLPARSPRQIIKQHLGLGTLEINYSRPSVRGRKIFGDLVPFNQLWRTGANEATILTLSEQVEMGGKIVDSGSYALYTIPGESTWEIVLNNGLENWGLDGYKESDDVLRFKVNAQKTKIPAETFSIHVDNITPTSCDLVLEWDHFSVSIPITVNFKDRLRTQIESALTNDAIPPYFQAAQFYKDYDKNFPKALELATKATEANPKAYWIFLFKAQLQKDLGDLSGALATSVISLELAKADKADDYVKMNMALQEEIRKIKVK